MSNDLLMRLRAGDDLHLEAAHALEHLRDRLVLVEAELATVLGQLDKRKSSNPEFTLKYEE